MHLNGNAYKNMLLYKYGGGKTIYQIINKTLIEVKTGKNVSTLDFIKVRDTTNFRKYSYDDINLGLKNSLFVVGIYYKNEIIGISRIIGDGKTAFIIKDLVVVPKYQRQKIGEMLMAEIFKYLDANATNYAYIGLMSTKGKESFYEKFGFMRRPNETMGSGMIMYYEKKNICIR